MIEMDGSRRASSLTTALARACVAPEPPNSRGMTRPGSSERRSASSARGAGAPSRSASSAHSPMTSSRDSYVNGRVSCRSAVGMEKVLRADGRAYPVDVDRADELDVLARDAHPGEPVVLGVAGDGGAYGGRPARGVDLERFAGGGGRL